MASETLNRLWSQALASERSGDLPAALAGYGQILTDKLETGKQVPSYLCERFGIVAATLGAPREGIAIIAAASEKMQRRGDTLGVFRSGLRIAEICLSALDPDSAVQFLNRCALPGSGLIKLNERDPDYWLSAIARAAWPARNALEQKITRIEASLVLARYYNCIGRFRAAQKALRLARNDLRGSERVVSRSNVAIFAAQISLQCGDLNSAEAELRGIDADEGGQVSAAILLIRARIAALHGRLSDAKSKLSQAFEQIRLSNSSRCSRLEFQIVLDRVRLMARLNRVGEADAIAAELGPRLGDDPLSAGFREQLEEAKLFVARKAERVALDAALPFAFGQLMESAVAESRRIENRQVVTERGSRYNEAFGDEWSVRFNRLLFALDSAYPDDCDTQLARLEAFSAGTDSPRFAARTRYARALANYYRGHLVEAEQNLNYCVNAAQAQSLRSDELEALELLAWTSLRLGKSERYREYTTQAMARWNEFLRDIGDEDVPFVRLNKWSKEDQFISARMRELGKLKPSRIPWVGHWLDRRRYEAALWTRFREIDALVGWKLHGDFRPDETQIDFALNESSGLDAVARTQALLRRTSKRQTSILERWAPLHRVPKNVAVLYFYVAPDRVFTFLMLRGKLIGHWVPLNRIELDSAVRELGTAILDQASTGEVNARIKPLASRLAEQLDLRRTMAAVDKSVDTLVVVPHDVLVNVPFAGLPFTSGVTLSTRFFLANIPHLSLLALSPLRETTCAAMRRYVGIAGAAYPNWDVLPNAEAELKDALEIFEQQGTGGKILGLEHQPPLRLEDVLLQLEQADFVHFSCHGQFDPRIPHRTKLLLGDSRSDASLQLMDIEQRRLKRLKLVLVSACFAADTATIPGGEKICLPAAFLRAGVQAVIAPLWAVEDESARTFAGDLCRELASQPSLRALGLVQRRWAESQRLFCDWAGYAYYGPA